MNKRTTKQGVGCFGKRSVNTIVLPILSLIFALFSVEKTFAQWPQVDPVNGVKVYQDPRTGLEWTATIGQVQSSGWGAPAQALVARYGFRLPSFHELQVMEANGGFRPLRITTAMQQYYETSNPNVLAAAWGNGFRTPQQRKGAGKNWVIGVREPVIVEGDEFMQPTISQPTVSKPTVSKPTIQSTPSKPTTQSTTTKPPSVNVTSKPNSQPASTTKPGTDKPNVGKLPTLPNYDG